MPMPLPQKMPHGHLRNGNEPRNVDKQRVAVLAPFQFRICVAGSRAYDEQINRPEFIEKGLDCSSSFFAFRKINAPDKCVGANAVNLSKLLKFKPI